MLGQAQTTSLFFSGQRQNAGTLSFPQHPYTFAVQKERLSDGETPINEEADSRKDQ